MNKRKLGQLDGDEDTANLSQQTHAKRKQAFDEGNVHDEFEVMSKTRGK